MKRFGLLFLFIHLFVNIEGKSDIIIDNQNSFDALQEQIVDLIIKGESNISVVLRPGEYYFKENHVNLSNINSPNLKISIRGEGSVLIPDGITYCNNSIYSGGVSIYSSWMNETNDVSIWGPIRQSDGLVEVLDFNKKLCRLKSSQDLKDNGEQSGYILITQWYKSNVYKIDKIEKGDIYFIATDLSYSSLNKKVYSINDDYNYLKKNPRYRLCNVENLDNIIRIEKGKILLPKGIDKVHEGRVSTFLCLENSSIFQLEIDYLVFYGSTYNYPNSFITFKSVQSTNISINNCSFFGMHNNVISIVNTNNVSVSNNKFKDIYLTGIQSDNRSCNIKVINNSFFNAGLGLRNTFCVFCTGDNYLISGNKLENYGYGGIRVGLWYLSPQYNKSNGIVEKNTLLFPDSYINIISKDGLMDGGAIYISSNNEKAIVRNNYIQGYAGAGGNRGIFCDDGASGFEIYGNVVINIAHNDLCIASRREPSVEKKKDSQSNISKSNVNNLIRDNLIDGGIMFKGHESFFNGCLKGTNYILLNINDKKPNNAIENIWVVHNDVVILKKGFSKNRFIISKSDYRRLAKSKEWNYLKHFVSIAGE